MATTEYIYTPVFAHNKCHGLGGSTATCGEPPVCAHMLFSRLLIDLLT